MAVSGEPKQALRWGLRFALATAPAVAAVVAFAFADPSARLGLLSRLLYWTMPVVAGIALLALVRRWRVRERGHAKWLLLGAAFAIALTALLVILVPPTMRMQFDETSLVGTSQNMHEQRASLLTTGAVPFEGTLVRLENTVDKRPPLFAFLVSLVHDLTGSRVANAFFVNGALLAVALLLVFLAARRALGPAAAVAAPLLLLAVPLTGVVATCAGFELLAGALLLALALAAFDFVRRPDPVRWSAMLGLALLFASARYESLLAAALMVGLAALLARGRWRPDRFGCWLLSATPTLLAPLGMLLVHARNPRFYPEAAGRPLLAFSHLVDHVGPFFRMAFADWRGALPGVLSVLAVIAWGAHLVTRRVRRNALLVVVPVLALTLLSLAWFFGDVGDPGARRLFLPFCWFVALSPLLLVRGPRSGLAAAIAAAALAAWRVADLHEGRAFPNFPIAQLTSILDRVVPQLAVEPRTTLWVGTPAQHLVVMGHAALCAQSFLQRAADIQQLVRRGEVRTIYLIETPLDAAFAPAFGDPRDVLRTRANEVVLREGGPAPITVHRLRP